MYDSSGDSSRRMISSYGASRSSRTQNRSDPYGRFKPSKSIENRRGRIKREMEDESLSFDKQRKRLDDIEERERLSRIDNMLLTSRWSNYGRKLHEYHVLQRKYIKYLESEDVDQRKLRSIMNTMDQLRNDFNTYNVPTYVVSGHSNTASNSLFVIPEDIFVIAHCVRGEEYGYSIDMPWHMQNKTVHYYPGMLMDDIVFSWNLFDSRSIEDRNNERKKQWNYSGILRMENEFDGKLMNTANRIPPFLLGPDSLTERQEIITSLGYNDDSVVPREKLAMHSSAGVRLSTLIKYGFKNKSPCTIIIHGCRFHQRDIIPRMHACGRYGRQEPDPGIVVDKLYQPTKPEHDILRYDSNMLLRHTDQGDITFHDVRTCSHPRTDFVQAVDELLVEEMTSSFLVDYVDWLERMKICCTETDTITYEDLCIVTEVCDRKDIPPEIIHLIFTINSGDAVWSDDTIWNVLIPVMKSKDVNIHKALYYISDNLTSNVKNRIVHVSREAMRRDSANKYSRYYTFLEKI